MDRVSATSPSSQVTLVRRLALGSVVANVGIVLTGGAVRLTDSGLGCPTWPRCTDDSYIATSEMGVHGVIEFGNRLLTFVLGAIAIAGVVAAWRTRPRHRRLVALAVAAALGIPAQAVIGGLTVLSDLNPWVVGLHFLASMVVIACAYAFWRVAHAAQPAPAAPERTPAGGAVATVPGPLRALAGLVAAVTAALLIVGTWVTGSGPHSGDSGAARNGLDPQAISQVHADLAFLLLGLALAAWLGWRAVAPAGPAARAAGLLVAVVVGQGVVGMVQHFTGLPELLVALHLLGSCLTWLAALHLWHTTHTHAPAVRPLEGPVPVPVPATAH